MKLRGIEFGNVLAASGVQGFFGEGYWFHRFWKPFGFDFQGVTFVAKTATLLPCEGNMPLTNDFTPKNLFPGCVKIKFFRGLALNSVGLSNPGLRALFITRKLQKRRTPFFISIKPTGNSVEERLEDIKLMAGMIKAF